MAQQNDKSFAGAALNGSVVLMLGDKVLCESELRVNREGELYSTLQIDTSSMKPIIEKEYTPLPPFTGSISFDGEIIIDYPTQD